MASRLTSLQKGQTYRTASNQGLKVRVLDIFSRNGRSLVTFETVNGDEIRLIEQRPYHEVLQQMNDWRMFELPTLTS